MSTIQVLQQTLDSLLQVKADMIKILHDEEHPLHLIFNDQSQDDLVVLADHKHKILTLAFQKQNIFIWLDENDHKQKSSQIKEELGLGYSIVTSQHLDLLEQVLKERLNNQQTYIIITSLKLAKDVQEKIHPLPNVDGIICYCMNLEYYKKIKAQNILGEKFLHGTNLESELKQFILKSRFRKPYFNILPNFISLKNDQWLFSIQLRSMIIMIKRKFNRQKMVARFCQIVKVLQNIQYSVDLQKFQKQASKGQLGLQKSFEWYTRQCPVYRTLNKILRSATCSTQIMYTQAFFKDLFTATKQLYKKQNQKSEEFREFRCYRGCIMSEKEIEFFKKNIGEVVQNLGYFSTSLSRQVAQKFAGNVMINIQVLNLKRQKEIDFGYGFIKEYSVIKKQQEVLFNPLNTFKVLNFIPYKLLNGNKGYLLEISYGELSRIVGAGRNHLYLTQRQQHYYKVGENQIGELKNPKTQLQLIKQLKQKSEQCKFVDNLYKQKYIDFIKEVNTKITQTKNLITAQKTKIKQLQKQKQDKEYQMIQDVLKKVKKVKNYSQNYQYK